MPDEVASRLALLSKTWGFEVLLVGPDQNVCEVVQTYAKQAITNQDSKDQQNIVTCRLDDDDAMGRHCVNALLRLASSNVDLPLIVSFPHGKLLEIGKYGPAICDEFEPLIAVGLAAIELSDNPLTILGMGNHKSIWENYPVHLVPKPTTYLTAVHANNDSIRIWQRTPKRTPATEQDAKALETEFGIRLADLNKATS